MHRHSLLLACILLMAACGGSAPPSAGKPGQGGKGRASQIYPVELTIVQPRPFPQMVRASGSVNANETVRISARVAGVLERVLVTEGDHVEKGQPISEIDPERYRVALDAVVAGLKRAELARDEARSSLARRTELRKQDLVSEEDLANVRLRSDQAEAEVRVQQAAVAKARLDLADAKVVAPCSGIIQARSVDTGTYLQPGSPIAILVNRDPLQVRFSVTVDEAARLAQGMPLRVRARGLEGDFVGRISLVAAAADPGSRLVGVVGRVEDPQARLRPGSFVEVQVEAGADRPQLAVPELSVRASDRGFVVFVAEPEGEALLARERPVQLGIRDPAGFIEIRTGLSGGERVVVRGADAIRDRSQVREVPAQAQAQARSATSATSARR